MAKPLTGADLVDAMDKAAGLRRRLPPVDTNAVLGGQAPRKAKAKAEEEAPADDEKPKKRRPRQRAWAFDDHDPITAPPLDDLVQQVDDDIPPWRGVPPKHKSRSRVERIAATKSAALEIDAMTLSRELIVDKNGRPRQAGASPALFADSPWVTQKRTLAERSLYYFTRGVLRRKYLDINFHKPVCDWLQTVPPLAMDKLPTGGEGPHGQGAPPPGRRKGLLMPREHAKSSIVAHSLPIHIHIQPLEHNIYFPGESGADQRIILMCETEKMGKDRLRVVQAAWESNQMIRAFWPERVWEAPRRQAKKWNDVELIIPRKNEFPDPSLRAVGVGGAITGAHPSALIKDDLISFDAMNSELVMNEAIEYHKTSRALIGRPTCLEWIIGTRWAVYDLYSESMENDPTVSWWIRSMVENGRAIYPSFFPLSRIADLQAEHGIMFPLFYMNSAGDPDLVDFDMRLVRNFAIEVVGESSWIVFEDDERDAMLLERQGGTAGTYTDDTLRGAELTSETYDILKRRHEHLRQMRVAA